MSNEVAPESEDRLQAAINSARAVPTDEPAAGAGSKNIAALPSTALPIDPKALALIEDGRIEELDFATVSKVAAAAGISLDELAKHGAAKKAARTANAQPATSAQQSSTQPQQVQQAAPQQPQAQQSAAQPQAQQSSPQQPQPQQSAPRQPHTQQSSPEQPQAQQSSPQQPHTQQSSPQQPHAQQSSQQQQQQAQQSAPQQPQTQHGETDGHAQPEHRPDAQPAAKSPAPVNAEGAGHKTSAETPDQSQASTASPTAAHSPDATAAPAATNPESAKSASTPSPQLLQDFMQRVERLEELEQRLAALPGRNESPEDPHLHEVGDAKLRSQPGIGRVFSDDRAKDQPSLESRLETLEAALGNQQAARLTDPSFDQQAEAFRHLSIRDALELIFQRIGPDFLQTALSLDEATPLTDQIQRIRQALAHMQQQQAQSEPQRQSRNEQSAQMPSSEHKAQNAGQSQPERSTQASQQPGPTHGVQAPGQADEADTRLQNLLRMQEEGAANARRRQAEAQADVPAQPSQSAASPLQSAKSLPQADDQNAPASTAELAETFAKQSSGGTSNAKPDELGEESAPGENAPAADTEQAATAPTPDESPADSTPEPAEAPQG